MRRQVEPATANGPRCCRRSLKSTLCVPPRHGAMRLVSFITQVSVIDQILAHRRTRAATAAHADERSHPSTSQFASVPGLL